MKSKFLSILLAFVLSAGFYARADEGMWLPLLLKGMNYDEMVKKGLKLTPEQLYDVNHSSLKDAIVMLDGGGCTGEIISAEGLLLTNHHCGYGEIQSHSSVEHDYLKNGFWAYSKAEELPNPGKTASFLVRIDDVTAKIIPFLSDTMSESTRAKKIEEISKTIIDEAIKGTHYDARFKSMFDGNQYYLYVYETFKDVRLVGAPPESIGKFGGDTDNWMWPRHTGDFSMFRVYMSPDGKPAEYSKDNVPYKPKHFLPISIKGVKENDFAMIWGNPGRTNRYLTSYGVKLALDQVDPGIIKVREKKLAIMKEDMDASPKVRIQYASKYAQTSNYWKYFIGQTRGLKRLNVIDEKKALEDEFDKWVNADPERKKKYGTVTKDFADVYKILGDNKYSLAFSYYNEFLQGAEVLGYSLEGVYNYYDALSQYEANKDENTAKALEEAKKALIEISNAHFKDYNLPTDKKIFAALLEMLYNDIPNELHPSIMSIVHKKFKGDFNKYADYVYDKSIFVSLERVMSFLEKPSAKAIAKDPAFNATLSGYFSYVILNAKKSEAETKLTKAKRLFVAGLMEMQPNKKFYPDANSTTRCTYGIVDDYFPADAVHYDLMTTLKGVMEKEDASNPDFIVEKKLKELYNKKDFGRYGMGDKMPVCFLTNNDITGGNSGSPVINANGELIGAAFDGNWEAMSGDIAFETELQRTICCDIRYILFIIDKYAGAKNLINEMQIIEN